MATPYKTSEVVRSHIVAARAKLDETDQRSIDIKLPLPYAPVTVHRSGAVTVTETGMRVFSLEATS